MTTDNTIIEEAIRLVNKGITVTFPVNGKSMLPFIVGGKDCVILTTPSIPKVGLIVLAWVDESHYVVHRVVHIDGHQITLMGDGNRKGKEHCDISDIKAMVTHVIDEKGNRQNVYSWWRKVGAFLWYYLLPIRRYLLAIYRRL